ncbi:MAG: DUF2326 domain-containing protein [Planctomycetales bacterium]
MLRLHRLSSEPECFAPITFKSGINLILGERTDETDRQGRKVNGVGKSICIEFLHFALCRRFQDTRVSRIPKDVLPDDLVVVLDLTIGDERVQIRRSIANPDQPTVVRSDGTETVCESLDDATGFLASLLFGDHEHAGQVSFRQVLSLLMRDERSEFKSYINPHDVSSRAADDISPHLFLLGIDTTPYCRLMETIRRLDSQQKVLREIKASVTNGGQIRVSDIPAKLNEERQATRRIEDALSTLRADPAFEEVEGDLNGIEQELQQFRGERKKLSFQIDQIRSIPLPERIDALDLKIVYDRIKSGLGDLVEKSLDQAKEFKAEIERFQHALRQEELSDLEEQRRKLSGEIRKLSERHATISRQVDQQGVLKELRTGLEVATRRTDEYHRMSSQFRLFEEKSRELEDTKTDRSNQLHELIQLLDECIEIERSMNDAIVSLHEQIQQTSRASFRFNVVKKTTTKRPLSFDVRIEDDGSHSIDQVRVFLYDFALMFDPHTRGNHPGFLVHDNILEVDQDTLTRCLNYLQDRVDDETDFQYVLTLNRDKIDGEESRSDIRLDVDSARRASFTKAKQFLGKRYQER